jgi:hypothetical protein
MSNPDYTSEEFRKECREEFFRIVSSPETRKRGEELHKALSRMTWEDYMRKIY